MDHLAALDRAQRLHQQGRLREALAECDRILAQSPHHAPALHYSGLVLFQLGQPGAAAQRIEQSLRQDPSLADPWCNLGLVYQALGRYDEALGALQEAVRRNGNEPELWNNLASSYLSLDRPAEAEPVCRRALALDAGHAASWFNLALSLQAQGRAADALDCVTRAAELAPRDVSPAGLKAQLEQGLGRLDAARATIDAALAHHPREAPLHFQRAAIEEQQADLAGAARSYEQALLLSPQNGAALSELLFLRKRLADWHDLEELRARFRAGVAAGTAHLSPFCLLSDPSTRAEQRRCAERWSALFAASPLPALRRPLSSGRLRLGYLSADFHQHATAALIAGLFAQHDRQRFEVIGYSTGPDDASALRARTIAGFDRFVDAQGWPAERLAAQIRADRVDVVVDLKGHTDGAPTRAIALRPAPIQVNYLGYPGTMGADFIDYLIGDPVVTPFEHAADYAEALVHLPHSYQINDRQRPIAEAPTRPELGLPAAGVVFCCFNSGYKLNPHVFNAWMQIVAAVPGSVLWLLARRDDDPVVANLRREAAARNVDPCRLVFARHRPNAQYLGLYRRADLFLDTWPYNAHTTASDALWSGCPVLTWLGDTFAARVAASLLTAVGLPELIEPDVARYVNRAIALARDPAALVRYRTHLEGPGRDSALFDTAATTRMLEAAYLRMADQYRSGTRAPIRVDSGAL